MEERTRYGLLRLMRSIPEDAHEVTSLSQPRGATPFALFAFNGCSPHAYTPSTRASGTPLDLWPSANAHPTRRDLSLRICDWLAIPNSLQECVDSIHDLQTLEESRTTLISTSKCTEHRLQPPLGLMIGL